MSHRRDEQVFAFRGYLLLRTTERVHFLLMNVTTHSPSRQHVVFSLLYSVTVCYRLP